MTTSKILPPKQIQPIPAHAQKVFSGVVFDVYQWEQKLYDGTSATFEKLKRNHSAGVLPVTSNKEIIITLQQQPGLGEFYSVCGGVVELGEDPVTAAYREMVEETGFDSDHLDLWFASQYSSKIESDVYYFVARNAVRKFEPKPDAGEKIKVETINFDQLVEMIRKENFRDTAICLKILRVIHDQKKLDELREFILS